MLHVTVHETTSSLLCDSHGGQEMARLHKNGYNVKMKVSYVALNYQ